jgi:5'/3'-nucleotidase SurE
LREKAEVEDRRKLQEKIKSDGVESYDKPWEKWTKAGHPEKYPIYWVKGYPRKTTQVAVDEITSEVWGSELPDLVVSGINTCWNTGEMGLLSGTIANAEYAMRRGIPAISISGSSSSNQGSSEGIHWTQEVPHWVEVYSQLEVILVDALVQNANDAGDERLLPEEVFLNVHFPTVSDKCHDVDDFEWVWTRTDVNSDRLSEARPLKEKADISGAEDKLLEQNILVRGHCRITVTLLGKLTRPQLATYMGELRNYLIINPDPTLSEENQYEYLDFAEDEKPKDADGNLIHGKQEDVSDKVKQVKERLAGLLVN